MGKLTISMAIFNSYVSHNQRVISCSVTVDGERPLSHVRIIPTVDGFKSYWYPMIYH